MTEPDAELDLTGVPCPQNAARSLLRLAMMDEGEILQITIDDGEPIDLVPDSVELDGHTITHREQLADSRWVIRVRVE
jgi:TusA-related sulfurtransferase